MNKSNFSATEKLFRIAYKIGKTGRPFTDMATDCDIYMLNGVDMDFSGLYGFLHYLSYCSQYIIGFFRLSLFVLIISFVIFRNN